MKKPILLLLVSGTCFGQQPQQPIQDLNALIGKEVIVQRMPLCQPGTFAVNLAFAGKHAKVISLKASNYYNLSEDSMRKLPPAARSMIEDARKAATILVQFEDGTQLDSCSPITPSQFSNYFELTPGQTPQTGTQGAPLVPTPLTTSIVGSPNQLTQSMNMLPDDEVKLALGGKGRDHFVEIVDMGFMAAQGNQVPAIVLYMPEAILALRSETAKRQFTKYEPGEEDKRRSLMIVAQGYAGKTITEGCTSITRIVLLSDPSGRVVQEAYLSEPFDEIWRNNFGATNKCHVLRSKFSLDDVLKVRAAAPNGEFYVAVFSGSTNTKTYKVKKKHQTKLAIE